MNPTISLTSLLDPYKQKVEALLRRKVETFGEQSALRDACEYSLLSGGKRFRPALVLMVADGLNRSLDVSEAALAVEFFHTASLIADDLPCMDNDDERRNHPTLHRAHGEAVALLASYALIAEGYACIARNAAEMRKKFPHSVHENICELALENATFNTGIFGATGGQYLDLFPPDLSLEIVRETLHKKTVSLFEISFVLGWLFGGGSVSKLNKVKQLALHFGMAFQIADDIGDRDQDIINGRKINMANVFGIDTAKKMFHEEITKFLQLLDELQFKSDAFQQIGSLLTTTILR